MASTKSMATRVPMDEYIKFQKEAISLKMSISEFVTMKLYEPKEQEEDAIKGLEDVQEKKKCAEIVLRNDELKSIVNGLYDSMREEENISYQRVFTEVKKMMEVLRIDR